MRAYLVDDEKSAREVLKHHLKNIQDVKVVGEASKIEVAKKELEQLEIDILFLDISMPQGTGFDVLEMVDVSQVKVVFITAHSNYSIKAIKKGAFDYILKPIIFEELEICIDRIRKGSLRKSNPNEMVSSDHNGRIVIQERGRIRLVKKEDIYRVESEGNYSTIYIKNGEKIVLTKNMKKMEEEFFSEKPFSRVHQSHLVNLNFVEMIVPGDGFIVLENKEEIPLSRSRKETFLDALMGN